MNLKNTTMFVVRSGKSARLYFCSAQIAGGQVAWRYDLHAKGAEPRKYYLRELVFILSRFRRVNIPKWRQIFAEMKTGFSYFVWHTICKIFRLVGFSICSSG